MKSSLLLCISFIVFLTAPLLHAAEAAEPSEQGTARQEILILNSYHPGYAWSDDEQAGVIDVLQGKNKDWVPVIEYLDLKRLPDGRHLAKLKQLFRSKYQNQKFSAVIAMDNPALEFAIDNQAELFGNAPIVFCGINNYTPSLLKGRSDVTGIVEAIDLAGTIEIMLRLHPATREIFVPHDYTVTGLAVRKEIEALIPRFGAKVRFRFTDPMTMEELLKEMERLPGDSLVLPISFITDKSGRTFGMTETARLFSEHSPVPVYSTYEQRLGFGIVGGKLLSARIHGTNAARIALRVLAGEKASAIPVVFESDSQFMFDYNVMSRFGIPLSALPEGSTVINKPVSIYAAHRVVIQTALGIIVFMAVVISLLTINIIQRRRSAIALRKSEENFRRSLDDSPLGVRIVTLEGETIYANRAILDIYGYDSVEELKTTPTKNRYTPQSYAEFKIRREKRKGDDDDPFEYEISIVRKNGEVRHLQVFRKEILWNGERQFQTIYQDVTERKRAEEERERLLAEIAAKNQELESFVYTISHDLRAPLVSMDGFYSLLKRESQDQLGEQGQHYLERIRANVAHMNTLVTELLELSRIGRVVGPEEEIDVGVLLREIEKGLVLKLEQEGVEFIVQQPLPAVRGDRGRIRQVFANLIENAVKFRSLERGLRIEVGCEEERGFYRFHVRDNGIGILPQYQEQIFEPFRQLDRGIEGVGMGLALVKRIVAYHRGRFWVESELGKGSTFYFTIPDRTNDDVRSAKYDRRLTRKRREPMKGESK